MAFVAWMTLGSAEGTIGCFAGCLNHSQGESVRSDDLSPVMLMELKFLQLHSTSVEDVWEQPLTSLRCLAEPIRGL